MNGSLRGMTRERETGSGGEEEHIMGFRDLSAKLKLRLSEKWLGIFRISHDFVFFLVLEEC